MSYKLWDYLESVHAKWSDIENREEGGSGRTVRTASLIVLLVDQVVNGGLSQWYGNPTGRYADETVSLITTLGAEKTAALANCFLTSLRQHDQASYEERQAAVVTLEAERPGLEASLSDSITETFTQLVRLADSWLERDLHSH